MDNLRELIGQEVKAIIDYDNQVSVKGIVIDFNIESWYFETKNEPIYITVNIKPTEDLPKDFWDFEDFLDIPLINITKA
jgi:hypothetical protein